MIGAFTKNTLITFITRVLMLIFGIGASIIIARILGPGGKGIYSLAILLPTLLIAFTNFGIGPASVFFIGKRKYPLKEVFGNNIIYTISISIFAILIGLIVIFFFSNKLFPGVPIEYLLLALGLIPCLLFLGFVGHILLGLQKFKKYNFISFLQVFLFFILVAIFLLGFHLGIKAAIIAGILSFFITCLILFFKVKKETKGISLKPSRDYFKNTFLYGIKAHLGGVFSFLHYRIDIFLINIFINPLAVGFYSIAVGLSEQIWLISQSAATVLFPKVSSETDKKKLKEFTPLVFRNILLITIAIATLLFILSHWIIVLFFSEAFFDSILPFQILLIGTVAVSGWRILVNDLASRGKPMLNTYIIGISLFLNIILNILWIPKFGIIGAAWATAISYTVALLITIVIYSKISDNKIRDIIFIKKSDFKFYQNLFFILKNRLKI
jgi:O-antigen/teichoic acid export membrane protein